MAVARLAGPDTACSKRRQSGVEATALASGAGSTRVGRSTQHTRHAGPAGPHLVAVLGHLRLLDRVATVIAVKPRLRRPDQGGCAWLEWAGRAGGGAGAGVQQGRQWQAAPAAAAVGACQAWRGALHMHDIVQAHHDGKYAPSELAGAGGGGGRNARCTRGRGERGLVVNLPGK